MILRNPISALLCSLLVLLLGSCKSPHGAVAEVEPVVQKPRSASDPFNLIALEITGDSLVATVEFGGGFREHTFELRAAGAATKSLPRQQPLTLFHDADGDMGRALIRELRSFNLRPFRDPTQPMVRLRLEGWPELLEYRYDGG